MNDNGAWLCQIICNDNSAQHTIKGCNFDAFCARIGEENEIMYPIDSNATGRFKSPFDDCFDAASVHVRHFDDIGRNIRPEQKASFIVKIESDRIVQTFDNWCVTIIAQRNLTYVNAICHYQFDRTA